METLRQLHKEISMIKKHHDEMRRLSGEGFNVFEVLGLESSEVGLHSRLIAELINPNGSHGQGNVFLKLFLDEIFLDKIDRSDFSLIDVKVDYHSSMNKSTPILYISDDIHVIISKMIEKTTVIFSV